MEGLQIRYNAVCNNYLTKFSEQIGCKNAEWVDEPGGIAIIDDKSFSFDVIKYSVDNNVTKDELFGWYEYVTKSSKNNGPACSLKKWAYKYKKE